MPSKQLLGFKTIPISFSATSTAQHELFIKEDDADPTGKTLLVLNIPPYVTTKSLQAVFAPFGHVSSVNFQEKSDSSSKKHGFKQAHIIFKNMINLNKNILRPFSTSDHPILVGLDKWIKEYNYSVENQSELRAYALKVIASYDLKEKREKMKKNQEDDEGWITVTKKGRNPGISRKESVQNKLQLKIAEGKERKELKNFYRFQIKESKMKHIENLRKQFEMDKQRVNAMKQTRKFKPY